MFDPVGDRSRRGNPRRADPLGALRALRAWLARLEDHQPISLLGDAAYTQH
jgi:hypothetical protein